MVASEVRSPQRAQAAREIKALIADSVGKVEDGAKLRTRRADDGEAVTNFQKLAGW